MSKYINFTSPAFEPQLSLIAIDGERQPAESKDVVRQFRIEPRDDEKIQDLCADEDISLSEFLRKAVALAYLYFKHIDTLMYHSKVYIRLLEDSESVVPLIRRLTQKD